MTNTSSLTRHKHSLLQFAGILLVGMCCVWTMTGCFLHRGKEPPSRKCAQTCYFTQAKKTYSECKHPVKRVLLTLRLTTIKLACENRAGHSGNSEPVGVCHVVQSMQTSLKPNIFPVMTKNLMETVSCCSCSQQLRPETWTVAEESFAKTPSTAQKQPEDTVGGDYTSSTCSTTVKSRSSPFLRPLAGA